MSKRPIIKYYGSKFWLHKYIRSVLPTTDTSTYFEPFVGGGSCLWLTDCKIKCAADINQDLISAWGDLKYTPEDVKDIYRYFWNKRKEEGNSVYYFIRDLYNQYRESTLYLILTRMCVNGKIRLNKRGEFNSSVHLGRDGIQPDTFDKIVDEWREVLDSTVFLHADYKDTCTLALPGDVVFMDPPYFGDYDFYSPTARIELDEFLGVLDDLNRRNVLWIITLGDKGVKNYDTPNVPEHLWKFHMKVNTGKRSPFKQGVGIAVDLCENVWANFNLPLKTTDGVTAINTRN